jgi:hypothetical protein
VVEGQHLDRMPINDGDPGIVIFAGPQHGTPREIGRT